MSCEKGFCGGEPRIAITQNLENNVTNNANSNSVFSDESFMTPIGNAGNAKCVQNCMLPQSISQDMIKFGNHIGGISPP
jgi:hypothetical protein